MAMLIFKAILSKFLLHVTIKFIVVATLKAISFT